MTSCPLYAAGLQNLDAMLMMKVAGLPLRQRWPEDVKIAVHLPDTADSDVRLIARARALDRVSGSMIELLCVS